MMGGIKGILTLNYDVGFTLHVRRPRRRLDPESAAPARVEEFKDFHTHKAVLSIASTVFHDMFSIPQPVAGNTAIPVVEVAEPAGVLETFLRLIYPIEPPAIDSLGLVEHLFRLAEKYVTSGVHAKLRQILVSPSFLRDDPICVYAIACHANLNEEAELATPHTYRLDLVRDIPGTHLQMMTAETYNRLLIFPCRSSRQAQSRGQSNQTSTVGAGGCTCGGWFYTRLRKEITLAVCEIPSLDRRRLDSCPLHFCRHAQVSMWTRSVL